MSLFIKDCMGIIFFWAVVYSAITFAILKGC